MSRRATIVFLIVFAIVAFGAYSYDGDPARAIAEVIPLAIACVVVYVAPRPSAALIALIIAQRVTADGDLIPTNDPHIAYPRTPIFAPMLAAKGAFRIVGTNGVLLPNTATMYGLEDARGTTAMTFAALDETAPLWCNTRGGAFANLSDLTRPMLSMLNVRFAIAYAGEMPPSSGWHEVLVDAHTRLLENERVLPRVYIPRRVVFGDDLEAMKRETDFGARSWIDVAGASGEFENGSGTIDSDMNANIARDAWVVVSQTAWRGWRAYVDDRPVKLARANHAFLAFHVPAGRHRVRLVYLPRSFVIGRSVTLGTLLFLFGGRLFLWRWRSRR
jgi:hypothetical protein